MSQNEIRFKLVGKKTQVADILKQNPIRLPFNEFNRTEFCIKANQMISPSINFSRSALGLWQFRPSDTMSPYIVKYINEDDSYAELNYFFNKFINTYGDRFTTRRGDASLAKELTIYDISSDPDYRELAWGLRRWPFSTSESKTLDKIWELDKS